MLWDLETSGLVGEWLFIRFLGGVEVFGGCEEVPDSLRPPGISSESPELEARL
jgi:hypothetical protein